MSYLHGETNDFPLEVERLITKNNKKFFFKFTKDKIKTLIFNLTHGNLTSRHKSYALNQQGVLDQDFFKGIDERIEILSLERLKINYTILNINYKLESRIEETT